MGENNKLNEKLNHQISMVLRRDDIIKELRQDLETQNVTHKEMSDFYDQETQTTHRLSCEISDYRTDLRSAIHTIRVILSDTLDEAPPTHIEY